MRSVPGILYPSEIDKLHRVLERACAANACAIRSDAGSDLAVRVLLFHEKGLRDEIELLLSVLGGAEDTRLVAW